MEHGKLPEADWAPHGEGGSRPMSTSRFPQRARDWKQLLLVLVIVAGVIWAVQRALPDASSSYVKVDGAHEQLADRFVQALLVRGDCAAAGQLAARRLELPGTKSCWSYVDRELGQDYYRCYLVRGSGAVVPGCQFDGRLGARCGAQSAPQYDGYDDCVAYRLVTSVNGGYQGGYLAVWPHPRHGTWKIERLDAEPGACKADCRQLWARRLSREQA